MDKLDLIKSLYSNKYNRYKTITKGKNLPTTETRAIVLKRPVRPIAIKVKGLVRDLFKYQELGVGFIEQRNGRAILGDEPGLGKTAQSLAYLQLHLEYRPAVILCPASLKLNWAKEVFMWTEKREENSVYLLSGKTNRSVFEVSIKGSGKLVLTPCEMPTSGIMILNYDSMPNKKQPFIKNGKPVMKNGKPVKVDIPDTGWIDSLKRLKPEIILIDEAQYIKNANAERTKAVLSFAKGIDKIIAMTGTLIENRPLEAFSTISLIDPTLFPSAYHFKMRYCGAKFNGYGWDFSGASNIAELHTLLNQICIRRLKKDVLKDLPEKIRSVVPIEIDNATEYAKAEKDLISWLKQNKGSLKAEQASKIEALARINELKQLCVKGKIESCLDWIEDFLESGNKLVVFTTHTWVLDRIFNEFKESAVKVNGSVTGLKRNEAVEEFQNNPKVNLFVGDLIAAGVGLTLTAASATCTLELGWNPSKHDQAEDRVHRIGQKADSVMAYYLLAAGTIEEDLAEMIDNKRKVVNAVLDGKDEVEFSFLEKLLGEEEQEDG